MKESRFNHDIGKGGYRCPCCGPAPKDRKVYKRRVKRRVRDRVRRMIEEEILTLQGA